MTVLVVTPELLMSAAADVQGIGSVLRAAHMAAAVPTTGAIDAGADEVSAAITSLFNDRRSPLSTDGRAGARIPH